MQKVQKDNEKLSVNHFRREQKQQSYLFSIQMKKNALAFDDSKQEDKINKSVICRDRKTAPTFLRTVSRASTVFPVRTSQPVNKMLFSRVTISCFRPNDLPGISLVFIE